MSLETTGVLGTVFALLLATNLVGNTLVVLVILDNRSMKTAMNYLLLNLAVADLMVGCFFAPSILLMPMSSHPTGTAGDLLCKMITGKNLAWMASLASAFTLVLISLERFYAVVYPLDFRRKITKRKLAFILPVLWLLAIILTLPSFVADRFDEGSNSCKESLPCRWQNVLYAIVWVADAAVIPVSIMAVLYSCVIYVFWFKKSTTSDATSHFVRILRKRITVMVLSVSVFYALCCFPSHILYHVYIFHPNLFPNGSDLFFPISYILIVLNSSLNPFVYIFQCAEFRICLKKLICCKRIQNGHFLTEIPESFMAPPPRSGPCVREAETSI